MIGDIGQQPNKQTVIIQENKQDNVGTIAFIKKRKLYQVHTASIIGETGR